jgi:hypothetical protein
MNDGRSLLLKASFARNQQRLGQRVGEQLLTDAERARMDGRQLMLLHSMGETLSIADRAKFDGRQLLLFASMGNDLTAQERQRLSPRQLMLYRTMRTRIS